MCFAARRGTRINISETLHFLFRFFNRNTITVFSHIVRVVVEPLCKKMGTNVQGLFTICIIVWCFLFRNDWFGTCLINTFVSHRRQSVWTSQKSPGRETELYQWGKYPKVCYKYFFKETKHVLMWSMLHYFSPRPFSWILNMQKWRTFAPNLKCLKVSIFPPILKKCFKAGVWAEICDMMM